MRYNKTLAELWTRALTPTWDALVDAHTNGDDFQDSLPGRLGSEWDRTPVEAHAPWALDACRLATHRLCRLAMLDDAGRRTQYDRYAVDMPFFRLGCEFEEQLSAVAEALDDLEPDSDELGQDAWARAQATLLAIETRAQEVWDV